MCVCFVTRERERFSLLGRSHGLGAQEGSVCWSYGSEHGLFGTFFTYRSNYTVYCNLNKLFLIIFYILWGYAIHTLDMSLLLRMWAQKRVLCFTQLQKDRKQLQTETHTKRQQNKYKVTQKSLQREKNECTKWQRKRLQGHKNDRHTTKMCKLSTKKSRMTGTERHPE